MDDGFIGTRDELSETFRGSTDFFRLSGMLKQARIATTDRSQESTRETKHLSERVDSVENVSGSETEPDDTSIGVGTSSVILKASANLPEVFQSPPFMGNPPPKRKRED